MNFFFPLMVYKSLPYLNYFGYTLPQIWRAPLRVGSVTCSYPFEWRGKHFLLSNIMKCCRLIFCPLCPSHKVSSFSKGPWFLSVIKSWMQSTKSCTLLLWDLCILALSVDRGRKYLYIHIWINISTSMYFMKSWVFLYFQIQNIPRVLFLASLISHLYFPSDGRESACNAGDMGSIPGSGRSLEKGNGFPTPVFLPREFHGQRSLASYSPWGCREPDMTEWLTLFYRENLTPHTYYLFNLCIHLK